MTRQLSALILSGVVGLGGLLDAGATPAEAQGYGPYGPGRGFGLSIGVGDPYGYGYGYGRGYPGGHYQPGFGPGYGYGRGYGYYDRGYYGLGYGPRVYSRTTVTTTTIIFCDRCGHYHARSAPCGGAGYGGGYFPGPYPW